MTTLRACPECQGQDQVQKVSAVFSSGASNMSLSGPTVGLSHTFGGAGGTALFGAYTGLSGGSQTLLSKRLAPGAEPEREPNKEWGIIFGFLGILGGGAVAAVQNSVIFVFVGIAVAFPFSLAVWLFDRANYNRDHPRWVHGIERWLELNYCHRCDGVFLPGDNYCLPADVAWAYCVKHQSTIKHTAVAASNSDANVKSPPMTMLSGEGEHESQKLDIESRLPPRDWFAD